MFDIDDKKFIIITLAVVFLLAVMGAHRHKSIVDSKRFYAQGNVFYAQGKYQDAYFNYKKISKYSDYYTLSLLKQYQCARNLSDKKTAYTKIKKLSKIAKDKYIGPYAKYNEANLAQELNLYSKRKLIKKYKSINKKYPDNDFGIASNYKMASLYKEVSIRQKDIEKAKGYYLEYLRLSPNGKYLTNALDELQQLKQFLYEEEEKIVADSYMANQNYTDALESYKNSDFSEVWYSISKCYRALDDKNNEKETILKGLSLKTSDVEEKDIDDAIDRLFSILNIKSTPSALEGFLNTYKTSYIYPTILYKYAESKNDSYALYQELYQNYPDSYWASNSLWEAFWYNYKNGLFDAAYKLYNLHIQKYPDAADSPRITYWYSKMLLKENKKNQAKDSFLKLIKKYPLSCYALLALRELSVPKTNRLNVKEEIKSYNLNSINKSLFEDKNLYYLAESGDWDTIDELKINNEYTKSRLLFKKGIYPKAIVVARDEYNKKAVKPKYSDYELKLIYPILYEDTINRHAKLNNISPYLFISIVREESHFDKNTKSSVGALGLSQVMPQTAAFIEKRQISPYALYTEEENISIGTKYFKYLSDTFDDNEYLAIIAYNAGPGNVKKWLQDNSINSGDIDMLIENIPYIETKNYIKKILSSYQAYLNIYIPNR